MLVKKVQLALIGSRPHALLRAIDELCTLPLSPQKGGTKRDFAVFASKIQLLSKKSATKVLYKKTSSVQVVGASFLYLTVHRCMACDVHIYIQVAQLSLTNPLDVLHHDKRQNFETVT